MSLLQMSLSGGAIILAVVLIRTAALHRLPKRLFPALWAFILLRLLVPLSLPAACSVYSLFSRPAQAAAYKPVSTDLPLSPSVWASEVTEAPALAGSAASIIDPWGMIWLTGFLVFAGYFAAAYIRCCLRFREALPVQNEFAERWLPPHRLLRPITIRQSDRIAAPLTYGILRPVILLPKSIDWDDTETLSYVLTHEWVHIRRFDGLFKLILTAALCIHWFNPLVWAMMILANRDMELACDEAVLRQLGPDMRAGYAMALIRLEETKSGPAPAGSHFSKTSIEERIQAIMKIKRNSVVALLLAICLAGGTAALFATSAKAESTENNAFQPDYTVEAKRSLLAYTDTGGTTYYSWDGGETWKSMTEEEFAEACPEPHVEWWTEEEYAAWLAKEKKELQDIIGSKGWTPSTGWFTWTQEMVTQAVAEYEKILALIKSGYLVSKTVEGQEDALLMSGAPKEMTGNGSYEVSDKTAEAGSEPVFENIDYGDLFEDYKRYGLTFKSQDGSLRWKGQRVRIFVDGAEYGDGFASAYEHYDPEGTIDVRTVREKVDNGDGSYDLMGPLVRLEEFQPEQIFLDALEGQNYVGAEISYGEEHTAQELERYAPFGLHYEFDQSQSTGSLVMTWNGRAVRSLFDPERQLWVCNSLGTKGLNLEAVYEDGRLTGLRESTEDKSFVETGVVINAETAVTENDGRPGSGETIAQKMERYAPYGVSYQETDGKKTIWYHGQKIERFSDTQPDGSVFSVSSTDGGEIHLAAAYDSNGRLCGVKTV